MKANHELSSTRKYPIVSDYKLSFTLIFQNFIPIFIVLAIGVVLMEILDYFLLDVLFHELNLVQNTWLHQIIYVLCKLPGDAIFYGFFGVCMGLCSDIMTSGDEFTQITRFPYYLRKYWLKFVLLCLLINFPFYLSYFIPQPWFNLGIFIFLWILAHFIYYFLVEINPGLIQRSKVLEAIKDNIILLKSQFIRILITFGIISIVFSGPLLIMRSLILFGGKSPEEIRQLELFHRIYTYIKIFIGHPLNAFLSIGIYNENIVFPLLQNKEKLN
ncbi:hypothetical protein DSAG12_03195 [Promethearchaeum syntrophicum]|uniref:Uncharacterized protein n=1 Tax=Promethearchaeum syntrophicum TaxID=2594042 RepID=A0A5B9DE44_9ARCH|nr:hypothetical protein [Candidatus Prometheoarchaeum syntrophicum]QEE17362.1 hypothetical protein DSAG12_03195 [Candidatus Prometheoarchaeum syntrophicum]